MTNHAVAFEQIIADTEAHATLEIEKLRKELKAEQEARRAADAELEMLRAQLKELAEVRNREMEKHKVLKDTQASVARNDG